MRLFDRFYSPFIYFGLIGVAWFAASNRAAHDIWAASIVFAVLTVLAVVFCVGRIRDRHPLRFPLAIPIILFAIALALSRCSSYDVEATWLELWGWIFIVVAYFLFVNTVRDAKSAEAFFSKTGYIMIPLAAVCVWQQITGQPQDYAVREITLPGLGIVGSIRYGHWEIPGTLINSVVLTGFALYWVLFYWKKMLEDRRYSLPFAACLVILILGRSWWGAVVLLGGFAHYYRSALITWARSHIKLCAIVVVMAGFSLAGGLYFKAQHREENPEHNIRYKASSRWYYWQSSLRMWRQHPWTGVGLGAFGTAYPYFKVGETESTRMPHGFPFLILSETGSMGTLAFGGLLSAIFLLRRRKHTEFDSTLWMVLAFSLISINMNYWLNPFMLFIVLGCCWAGTAVPAIRVRPLWLGAGAVGLVLLSSLWLVLPAASRLYAAGLTLEHQGDIVSAERLYSQAVSLEPYHAESYWQLSQIYHQKHKKTGHLEDLTTAEYYRQLALRYKKDVQFSR